MQLYSLEQLINGLLQNQKYTGKTLESSPFDVERNAVIRTGSIAEQTHFVKKKIFGENVKLFLKKIM